jgi:hypothetical protein
MALPSGQVFYTDCSRPDAPCACYDAIPYPQQADEFTGHPPERVTDSIRARFKPKPRQRRP